MTLSGGMGFQSTKVMARSPGPGGKTSTARALARPGSTAAVTLYSNRRQAPAMRSGEAIRLPFIQTAARKLMPEKRSQAVLPRKDSGTGNSVRYHQECRKGLSGGISMLEKLAASG